MFCSGPYDPELARLLHPTTLRAQLGENVARNALHCTDLIEDGNLECSYFFQLMARGLPPPDLLSAGLARLSVSQDTIKTVR